MVWTGSLVVLPPGKLAMAVEDGEMVWERERA